MCTCKSESMCDNSRWSLTSSIKQRFPSTIIWQIPKCPAIFVRSCRNLLALLSCWVMTVASWDEFLSGWFVRILAMTTLRNCCLVAYLLTSKTHNGHFPEIIYKLNKYVHLSNICTYVLIYVWFEHLYFFTLHKCFNASMTHTHADACWPWDLQMYIDT
jgi:hypothetical protein